MGNISQTMRAYTYPYTMKRGRFKGQTFASYEEYRAATQQAQRRQRARPTVAAGKSNVRAIIEAYELLVAQGVGRSGAIRILETLMS